MLREHSRGKVDREGSLSGSSCAADESRFINIIEYWTLSSR